MKECKTCGKPTQTVTCDSCWEVERRLGNYLKTPGGRAHVVAALLKTKHVGGNETLAMVASRIGTALMAPQPGVPSGIFPDQAAAEHEPVPKSERI